MDLRVYLMPDGFTYQYEAGQEPKGAVELLRPEEKQKPVVPNKARKPANKSRTATKK